MVGGFLFDEYLCLKYIKVTYKDLIQQYITTGKPITRYQLYKISSSNSLLKSYFGTRKKAIKIEFLEQYELIFLIEKKGKILKEFLIDLDDYNIFKLLMVSRMSNEIIDIIGEEKAIDVLRNQDIERILRNINRPGNDRLIKLLINIGHFPKKYGEVEDLLYKSEDKENIIKYLLMYYINNDIDNYNVLNAIIDASEEKDEAAEFFIKNSKDLNFYEIDKIVWRTMSYDILKLISEKFKISIEDIIYELFKITDYKDIYRDVFNKHIGIDKDIINNIIINNNIDVKLIP